MRYSLFAVALLLAAPLLLAGENKKVMQPGEAMKPFDVKDVTGKYKADEKVCYV